MSRVKTKAEFYAVCTILFLGAVSVILAVFGRLGDLPTIAAGWAAGLVVSEAGMTMWRRRRRGAQR